MIGDLRDPSWSSRVVSARAECVLAPNPNAMTLDGTNTWLLAEPGADEVVVLDPGPLDEGHLRLVTDQACAGDRRVSLIALTHGHLDHSEGALRLAELTGAPVRSLEGGDFRDGDIVRAGDLEVVVVATPGHTSDSLSFLLPAENALLTGDTILGRGTAVIYHPDGVLTAYLDSLERIQDMTRSGAVTRLLPGHGPVLEDAAGVVQSYLDHRAERLDEVRAALAAGDRDVEEILHRVYAEVPRAVWPAARRSIMAQLVLLRERGEYSGEESADYSGE